LNQPNASRVLGRYGGTFADGANSAPNLRRRPCYANSACCSCRGIAGCGRVGADLRFRLGRSRLAPRWMARRLGRSPLLRRWPGPLWFRLRRLLCATIGPHTVGIPLAPDKSLLLIQTVPSRGQKPRPCRAGAFHLSSIKWNRASRSFNFYWKSPQSIIEGKHFPSRRLGSASSHPMETRCGTRHEQPNHRQQRTDRSQDEPLDLRRHRRTAAAEPASGYFASVVSPAASDG
jgi:hypothetical protein